MPCTLHCIACKAHLSSQCVIWPLLACGLQVSRNAVVMMHLKADSLASQDSQDPNPLIRALAVRTMGCIRVDKITEYLCDPLQRCLKASAGSSHSQCLYKQGVPCGAV